MVPNSVYKLQGGKNTTMVSVIITVFEQRISLEMLLYCLRAQDTEEAFEVIICDDGSSVELFSAICANPDFLALDIRYIWQRKAGYRAARSKNNGIKCARGDLLVFLDGDILIRPSFITRHRSAHNTTTQIVCNPRRWIFSSRPSPSKVSAGQRNSDGATVLHQLADLSKKDITCLLEMLEKISFDVERPQQQLLFSSNAPWMSCIGFSFSIDKGPEVWFDENFEGWGPEDSEFALRMVKKHGYTVSFEEEIETFHLEACSTGRPSSTFLPNKPPHIVSYLRNMVYFRAMYPNEDLSRVMLPLMNYRLNAASNCWELSPDTKTNGVCSAGHLATQISSIEDWLRANSLFPSIR